MLAGLRCDGDDYGYQVSLVPKRQARVVETATRGSSPASAALDFCPPPPGDCLSQSALESFDADLRPCTDVCIQTALHLLQHRLQPSAFVCPPQEALVLASTLQHTDVSAGPFAQLQEVQGVMLLPFLQEGYWTLFDCPISSRPSESGAV